MTTTEIAPYVPGQPDEYRPRILMEPHDAKALDDQLRANQLAVLRKGVDYDTITGMGDRPTLLKPGAEKLLQWFGFGFTCERDETERDDDGNRVGVIYRCTVTKGLPGGGHVIVATCEGYAGYDEERFFQTAEQAWAKECALAERYKRQPRKWKAAEYRAPWNTVIKMAQKRALVGAAIDATAAAGLFTQDLEDMTPPPGRDDDTSGNGQHPAADDAWENAAPAPRRQAPAAAPPENGPRWADTAITQAASFKSEAEGQKLWRESAAAVLDGRCTPGEATHIQNIITARVTDRRRETAGKILQKLADDDPWRAKVEELPDGDNGAARGALEELAAIVPDQIDMDRGNLISRAIIARFPKAAITGDGDD